MKTFLHAVAGAVLGSLLPLAPLSAQTAGGSGTAVPAFPAFERWVQAVSLPLGEVPSGRIQAVAAAPTGPSVAERYQPQPVILGLPDLLLVTEAGAATGRDWSPTLNYMGLSVRQVVLDAAGRRQESRSMAQGPRPGERFKLRVTASFDAVAEVDQVVGDVWYGQRTGQVYPAPGLSVELKAGQTVDLPLAPHEYFVLQSAAQERLLLKVRHPRALREARSDQPIYRQDAQAASNYLQLVPRGSFPAFEQLVLPNP